LATLGLGALTFALTIGSGPGGWTTLAIVSVGVSIALLIAFIAAETQRGDSAMMPRGLFASSGFIGLTLLTLFLYGALGALFVLIPYEGLNPNSFAGLVWDICTISASEMPCAISPL